MTVNRRAEFQIETSILQGEDGKRVYKRALSEQAKAHVNHMCDYYLNSSKKEQLCPIHPVKDGEIYFDFVSGSSMNEEMLECLRQGKKEDFQNLLRDYRQFVEDSCELCEKPAEPDAACENVFGVSTWDFPGNYGRHLNIDLCFDNIMVQNQQKIIIDYEWIFDVVLPVNFVIYRSIFALYVKNAEFFRGQYTWQELYESMGMTAEEVAVYEKMNESFNEYVYGGEFSYNHLLPQYAKRNYELGQGIPSDGFLLQVLAEEEHGYSEADSLKVELCQNEVSQEMDVSRFAGATALRVDPCHVPCICADMQVTLTDTLGQSYELKPDQSNAYTTEQGIMVFTDDDPQMIYQKVWQGEPEKLSIAYTLQCVLKGEELERYRCLVTENAKAREGWTWFEQESRKQQEQIRELQQRNQELEQKIMNRVWNKLTRRK